MVIDYLFTSCTGEYFMVNKYLIILQVNFIWSTNTKLVIVDHIIFNCTRSN